MRLIKLNLDSYYFDIKDDDELRDVINYIYSTNNEIDKLKTYNITSSDRNVRRKYSCFQIAYSERYNRYVLRIIHSPLIENSQSILSIHEYLKRLDAPKDTIY